MVKIQFSSVLDSFSLSMDVQFNRGEFISIYGPSGVGKTSVLKTISGLSNAQNGFISFGNSVWFDSAKNFSLNPSKRKVAFAFQEESLFPHWTVQQNLTFAQAPNCSVKEFDQIIEETALGDLLSRKPSELSGGQKQRAILARCLVQKPDLLLLDEPFSSLDHAMQMRMQRALLSLHNTFALTTILVSHDLSEVIRMSDKVICMEQGKVTQEGTVEDVFSINTGQTTEGEILKINQEQASILVLINQQIIAVAVSTEELANYKVGDSYSMKVQRG